MNSLELNFNHVKDAGRIDELGPEPEETGSPGLAAADAGLPKGGSRVGGAPEGLGFQRGPVRRSGARGGFGGDDAAGGGGCASGHKGQGVPVSGQAGG